MAGGEAEGRRNFRIGWSLRAQILSRIRTDQLDADSGWLQPRLEFLNQLSRHFASAKNLYLTHRFAQIDWELPEGDANFPRHSVAIKLFLAALHFEHAFQCSERGHTAPTGDLQTDAGFTKGKGQHAVRRGAARVLQCRDRKGEGDRLEARGFESLFQAQNMVLWNGDLGRVLLAAG